MECGELVFECVVIQVRAAKAKREAGDIIVVGMGFGMLFGKNLGEKGIVEACWCPCPINLRSFSSLNFSEYACLCYV